MVGAPYILKVGQSWTPRIPYENPEHFITFRWFKKNIICADQPWICGLDKRKTTWWEYLFGRETPKFDYPG